MNNDELRKYPFGRPDDPREPFERPRPFKNPFADRPAVIHAILGRLMDGDELAFRGRYVAESGDVLPAHIQSEFKRGTFKTVEELGSFLLSQHWFKLAGRDFSQEPTFDQKDTGQAPISMGDVVRSLVEIDGEMGFADIEFYSENYTGMNVVIRILLSVPDQSLFVYGTDGYRWFKTQTLDLQPEQPSRSPSEQV